MPILARSCARGMVAMSIPVHGDPPRTHLVEAHEQVDERRLARPCRPDDGHRFPGFGHQGQGFDERNAGVVGERDVFERHPAKRRAAPGGAGASGLSSSASSTSRTRSSEAMPLWKRFIIDASWVIGIENWRVYWRRA